MQRRGREEEGPTCGCLEEERKGASEKRTTFEVGVHADPPKKQHLTATPVSAIKQPVFPPPPSPNNTSAAPQRASANAQVIDADAW